MDSYCDDLIKYGYDNELKNVIKAIPFVRQEISKMQGSFDMTEEYLIHGIMIARIISDMKLDVTNKEMDLLLSSAICHILCEINPDYNIKEGISNAGIDESIYDFVNTMVIADKDDNFSHISDNKLLFIIKLVERVNIIEHLCDMSTEESKAFIQETKRVLLPLCIDGKDKYPELSIPISVFMEKMRTLIQVMDILYQRYDTELEELYAEILEYKDENSRIRQSLSTVMQN